MESFARHTIVAIKGSNASYGHLIFSQRTGFIGTNDRGRTKGFNRFHTTNDRLVPGHVSHSKRQGDDQDDGQTFGNDCNKDCNGDNKLLNNDFA